MSLDAIKTELTEFLNSEEAGIFAVKGKWGVGKTYLIREIITNNINKWDTKKFAFVSLFGVNSLDSLKEQMFIKMQSTDNSKTPNKIKSAAKQMTNALTEIGNLATQATGNLLKLGLAAWIELGILNSKIIIDDIERRGDGLAIKDLLGFLSQLKEEKGCQIILVFNEDELKNDKNELDKYREKVIDREIEFVPDIDTVIAIGFLYDNCLVKEKLKQLKAHNIRAVQKAEGFIKRLEPQLKTFDKDVESQILQTATILAWYYFSRNLESIPWQFIKDFHLYKAQQIQKVMDRSYNRNAHEFGLEQKVVADENQEDIKQKQYAEILDQLGYQTTGPIEQLLINSLEQGFHSKNSFSELASNLESNLNKDKAIKQLRSVWEAYSDFRVSEQDFVDKVIERFQSDSEHYDPRSLDEFVQCLEELDKGEEAKNIIDLYFQATHSFEAFYEYADLPKIKNIVIKNQVKEIIDRQKNYEDTETVIKNYARGNSFRIADSIKQLDEEQWVTLIRECKISSFDVKKILEAVQSSATDKYIGQKVANAIKKIGSESTINKLRVGKFQELLDYYEISAEKSHQETNVPI